MDRVPEKGSCHCRPGQQLCSGEISSVAEEIHSKGEKVCLKRPSIYRVPEHLRKLNEDAYTPWHVSIGPFHHKGHNYRVMEECKFGYMKALIRRRRDSNNNTGKVKKEEINAYVKEVERLEPEARLRYAENLGLSKEEFVQMLLIDGCFIVEFLCRKVSKLSKFEDEAKRNFHEMYCFIEATYKDLDLRNDYILKSTRTAFEVRRDLCLLENQLPYFVLEKIYDFTFSRRLNKPNFSAVVYCAFRTSIPNITHMLNEEDIAQRIEFEPETTAHFVSFLKSCCSPISGNRDTIKANRDDHRIISLSQLNPAEFPCLCNMQTHEIRVASATKLAKSGVLFEKSEIGTPLLEINFDKRKGVLKIPAVIMWHHTETFFRNIMAYELYNHTANFIQNVSVSDFMCFMDDLINSKEDVALLVKSGIIQNWLESDEVVADLFNSITKHILADYSSYSDTCKKLNVYRKKYNFRQLGAVLQQDYFNQPWAIVYFITGVVIQTSASVIQAFFSVESNGNNHSSSNH